MPIECEIQHLDWREAEIRVRAERRAGELLRDLARATPQQVASAGGIAKVAPATSYAATKQPASADADTLDRTGIREALVRDPQRRHHARVLRQGSAPWRLLGRSRQRCVPDLRDLLHCGRAEGRGSARRLRRRRWPAPRQALGFARCAAARIPRSISMVWQQASAACGRHFAGKSATRSGAWATVIGCQARRCARASPATATRQRPCRPARCPLSNRPVPSSACPGRRACRPASTS